jgi:hypothetical protein
LKDHPIQSAGFSSPNRGAGGARNQFFVSLVRPLLLARQPFAAQMLFGLGLTGQVNQTLASLAARA